MVKRVFQTLVMVWTLSLGVATPSWAQTLVAAVLPSSRSVQVGVPATAFATIINVGPGTATGCAILPFTSLPATFVYQTTNPATNQVTGTANTPMDIAADGGGCPSHCQAKKLPGTPVGSPGHCRALARRGGGQFS